MGYKSLGGLKGGGWPVSGAASGSRFDAFYSGVGGTVLTQDLICNNLFVSNGHTLETGGYRIFCRGSCVVRSGGAITCPGANGGNGDLGAGAPGHTIGGGSDGGSGQASGGNNGVSLVGTSICLGSGGNGANGGGNGGSPSFDDLFGNVYQKSIVDSGIAFNASGESFRVMGGCGGGGGGGDGSAPGGGGGGGGGIIYIEAQEIILADENSHIRARGGAGGTVIGAGRGGGGGGGGGALILKVDNIYLRGGLSSTFLSAAGGPGGVGDAGVGDVGSNGFIYIVTPNGASRHNSVLDASVYSSLP